MGSFSRTSFSTFPDQTLRAGGIEPKAWEHGATKQAVVHWNQGLETILAVYEPVNLSIENSEVFADAVAAVRLEFLARS